MEPIIHNAVQKALMERPARRLDQSLWVSDLGKNPYTTIKRVITGEMELFDYATQLKMDGGAALEAFTLRQVAENLDKSIQTHDRMGKNR